MNLVAGASALLVLSSLQAQAFVSPKLPNPPIGTQKLVLPHSVVSGTMRRPGGMSLNALQPIAHEPQARYSIYDAATKDVRVAGNQAEDIAPEIRDIHNAFREWIISDAMPCIGAKNAMSKASYGLQVYGGNGPDPKNIEQLTTDLLDFCRYQSRHWAQDNHFTTFVAVFPGDSEHTLDAQQLDRLASRISGALRRTTYQSGAPFRCFLAVSLHPDHPAPARRFAHPAIVFNADAQFTHLKDIGKLEPIRKAIQAREENMYGPRPGKPKLTATTLWLDPEADTPSKI